MADTFVHFEIPADDLEKVLAFYAGAFGWQYERTPMPGGSEGEYVLVQTVEPGKPGMNGGIYKRTGPDDRPRTYIGVASMDESLEKVTALGGSVVAPKMAIPGIGWWALIADPEGNVFGLFQDDQSVR